MRRLNMVIGAAALGAVCAMAIGQAGTRVGGLKLQDDRYVLDAKEVSWLDASFNKAQRALLNSSHGYAPPAFGDDLEWHNTEPLEWDSLRGKVVVLQTWTNATSEGRATPRRVDRMLNRFSSDQVQVINVHTPEGAADLDPARLKGEPVAVDTTGAFCDEIGAYKKPVTVIIDRQGSIRYSGVSLRGLIPAVEILVDERYNASAPAPEALPSRDSRDVVIAPDANREKVTHEFPLILGELRNANDIRGEHGPELNVAEWLNGRPNTSGKLVLVEFWATWCGPCKANIPHLNELQDKYRDNLVIIGISDEKPETVKNFLLKRDFSYAIAADPEKNVVEHVGHKGIPYSYLTSPDGVVRWQGHPRALSESMLEEIMLASGLKVDDPAEAPKSDATEVGRWVR